MLLGCNRSPWVLTLFKPRIPMSTFGLQGTRSFDACLATCRNTWLWCTSCRELLKATDCLRPRGRPRGRDRGDAAWGSQASQLEQDLGSGWSRAIVTAILSKSTRLSACKHRSINLHSMWRLSVFLVRFFQLSAKIRESISRWSCVQETASRSWPALRTARPDGALRSTLQCLHSQHLLLFQGAFSLSDGNAEGQLDHQHGSAGNPASEGLRGRARRATSQLQERLRLVLLYALRYEHDTSIGPRPTSEPIPL